MENVEHLLKLSEEYQVKLIFDPCIKFVKEQPIRRDNAMHLLMIADMYGLDEVCQRCNNFLKDLKLKTLSETVHLEDLDLTNVRHFLEQRIKRLEAFLDTLYPQFKELLQCLPYLLYEADKSLPCFKVHADQGLIFRKDCVDCCKMLRSLIFKIYRRENVSIYGSFLFKDSLPSVIKDFEKLNQG